MKRKAITLFLTLSIAVSAMGCGRAKDNKDNTGTVENTENQSSGNVSTESVMESTENGTEIDFNQLQLGNAVEIPEGFEGTEGETDAHGELEKLLAEHLNIQKENYQSIRYYYNYVDLNGDSKNEILVMVMGESLNEEGGNRLLWIDDSADGITKDSIRQEFQGVSAPVYISNHMTEGYRDLILCHNIGVNNDVIQENQGTENGAGTTDNSGTNNGAGTTDNSGTNNGAGTTENGGTNTGANTTENGEMKSRDRDSENGVTKNATGTTDNSGANTGTGEETGNSGYVLLVWDGDSYQEISEGTPLEDLDGYEGNAIITNDMERDFREDTYHFLGEAMNL